MKQLAETTSSAVRGDPGSRAVLAGAENTMLSTLQIFSGAIYVAMQFAAASIVTVILTLDTGVATAADVATVLVHSI